MLKPFDKYKYYLAAVQSPEADMEFLRDVYRELKGRRAFTLREDFCGTFANCCAWVKMHRDNHAYGLDLDGEPIQYGRMHNLPNLKPSEQQRVHIFQSNVLTRFAYPVDIVSAFNFSFCIFKERAVLRRYFANALKSLNSNGIFVVDCFGGTESQQANMEQTRHRKFTYFWDQESFDPVTYYAKFAIHFQLKGEKKLRKRVFTYDWRLWTIPEIRDLMEEVGFSKTSVYWEGTTRNGKGDGNFKRVESGEECDGWIAYVVGEK